MSITPLPSAPAVTDTTSEFNNKAFNWVAALDTFTTQTNALAEQVSDDAAAAATAQDAADAAVAAANFKGAWSSLTGALNIPASVAHNDEVWLLTENLADVTSNEPGVGSPVVWLQLTVEQIDLILQPTNVSPPQGATDIGGGFGSVTLTGSPYYSLYGVIMAAGQWQLSTASDFSITVVDTGDVAGTSVSYNVAPGLLSTNTEYYWRVRYKDINGVYSEWSTATSFTTASDDLILNIGDAFGGGFYAGKIVQGGDQYAIIVAPKSSGESSSKQWKPTNDAGPTATQTLNNGPAASASMNSTTYPAAQFCEGLSIGGYTDWYLPSRDELELCYRNLKPTTDANNTSTRAISSYTYPEGNDVSGDTMGINRNSSPTGAAYTSGSPAQTAVTAFKSGGTEAFDAASSYWSSSEHSATYAWLQSFYNGTQFYNVRESSFYVRAVRRVAV